MPYGITRCYLPPGRGDIPAFPPVLLLLCDIPASVAHNDPFRCHLRDRVFTSFGCLSVPVSVMSRYSIKPAGRIELDFGMEASVEDVSKNKDTSLEFLSQTPDLEQIRHRTSIVATC